MLKLKRIYESEIQGLELYTQKELVDIITEYIQNKLEENELDDIEIKSVSLLGSRTKNKAREDSDLDALLYYTGDFPEDSLFNILHDSDDPLEIDGIEVDINPKEL